MFFDYWGIVYTYAVEARRDLNRPYFGRLTEIVETYEAKTTTFEIEQI